MQGRAWFAGNTSRAVPSVDGCWDYLYRSAGLLCCASVSCDPIAGRWVSSFESSRVSYFVDLERGGGNWRVAKPTFISRSDLLKRCSAEGGRRKGPEGRGALIAGSMRAGAAGSWPGSFSNVQRTMQRIAQRKKEQWTKKLREVREKQGCSSCDAPFAPSHARMLPDPCRRRICIGKSHSSTIDPPCFFSSPAPSFSGVFCVGFLSPLGRVLGSSCGQ